MRDKAVLEMVSAEGIFGMYLGGISERSKINSPFPDRNDPNPSFAFHRNDKGELLWIDFGRIGKRGGDCFLFVQEMFGLSRQQAIDRVWDDFKGKRGSVTLLRKEVAKGKGCRYGFLRDWELGFWKDFYLDKKDLEFWDTFSNRGYWSGEVCLSFSTPKLPSYAYVYGEDSYKTYTPNTSYGKFWSHNISDVVEGWNQLEGGGEDYDLILCSGKKDAKVVWKMGQLFGGITKPTNKIITLAPTTERSKTALLKRLNYLKCRYPNRYSLMDFDSTGWKAMREWKEHFNPMYLEPSWNKKMIKDVAEVARYKQIHYLYDVLRNFSN